MNDQFWITGNKKNSGTNFWTPKSASYITIVANLKKNHNYVIQKSRNSGFKEFDYLNFVTCKRLTM